MTHSRKNSRDRSDETVDYPQLPSAVVDYPALPDQAPSPPICESPSLLSRPVSPKKPFVSNKKPLPDLPPSTNPLSLRYQAPPSSGPSSVPPSQELFVPPSPSSFKRSSGPPFAELLGLPSPPNTPPSDRGWSSDSSSSSNSSASSGPSTPPDSPRYDVRRRQQLIFELDRMGVEVDQLTDWDFVTDRDLERLVHQITAQTTLPPTGNVHQINAQTTTLQYEPVQQINAMIATPQWELDSPLDVVMEDQPAYSPFEVGVDEDRFSVPGTAHKTQSRIIDAAIAHRAGREQVLKDILGLGRGIYHRDFLEKIEDDALDMIIEDLAAGAQVAGAFGRSEDSDRVGTENKENTAQDAQIDHTDFGNPLRKKAIDDILTASLQGYSRRILEKCSDWVLNKFLEDLGLEARLAQTPELSATEDESTTQHKGPSGESDDGGNVDGGNPVPADDGSAEADVDLLDYETNGLPRLNLITFEMSNGPSNDCFMSGAANPEGVELASIEKKDLKSKMKSKLSITAKKFDDSTVCVDIWKRLIAAMPNYLLSREAVAKHRDIGWSEPDAAEYLPGNFHTTVDGLHRAEQVAKREVESGRHRPGPNRARDILLVSELKKRGGVPKKHMNVLYPTDLKPCSDAIPDKEYWKRIRIHFNQGCGKWDHWPKKDGGVTRVQESGLSRAIEGESDIEDEEEL